MKKDIRKLLREELITEDKHKYGCVMLYMDISKDWWGERINEIDKDDIYNSDDKDEYGTTPISEVHVTLLYGLHGSIPDSDVEKIIDTLIEPEIKLKKISSFTNDKFDVLKFDVVGDSKNKLGKMNTKFTKLPHTTDYPNYTPHITIGYLKPNTAKKYIKTLSKDELLSITPNKIVYSKVDGTKKSYKFKK